MTDTLPSSDKELCSAVIDFSEVTKEELGSEHAKRCQINCMDCNKHKKFVPTRQSFANEAEHWKRFVKE